MTKKEKLIQLAMRKAERDALEMQIKDLQKELLSDWDWNFDLDWITVKEHRNTRYDFIKDMSTEFELEKPELVTKKYLTTWLSDEDKQKYFKKSLSTPFLKFD